jgi:trehalose-6-phosphate hydrolase
MNNFYEKTTKVKIPRAFVQGEVLIGNYDTHELEEEITLRPYETIAILVKGANE